MADLFDAPANTQDDDFARQLAEMDARRDAKRKARAIERGETCGNCSHASAVLGLKGYDTSFKRCAFVHPWFWFAPSRPCSLVPVKFQRRAELAPGEKRG